MKGLTITTLELWQHDDYGTSTLLALMNLMGQDMVKGPRSFIAFDRLKSFTLSSRFQDDVSNLHNLVKRAICLERLQIQGEFHILPFLRVSKYSIYS